MVTKIVDGIKIEITADEATAEYSCSETDAQKLKKIKEKRADKLQETDWWVLRGSMNDEQKEYRKKLRDISSDYSASDYDALLNYKTHAVWKKPSD